MLDTLICTPFSNIVYPSILSFDCALVLLIACCFSCFLVVVDVKETPQESFYEVVWAAGLAVRQGVKRNSLVVSSAPVGSILHIVEEITERCFGRSDQRGRLADGRGWVTISETGLGSSEPNVYMRESAKPFATGADVVPGERFSY